MVVPKFNGSEFQTLPLSGRFFVSLDTHRPTYDMYVCDKKYVGKWFYNSSVDTSKLGYVI